MDNKSFETNDGQYGHYSEEDEEEFIFDERPIEAIKEYENEAFDKVWYCRTQPCGNPVCEMKRQAQKKRIEDTYDNELPNNQWSYGYWSGILAALRWVLGSEKDLLDT